MSQKLRFFKNRLKEYIKFNIVGLGNFIVSQCIYIILFKVFRIHYLFAYTITSFLSVTASYFINSKFTFKQPNYSRVKFYLSILVYILEYVINMSVIIFLVNKLNFHEIIAPLISPIFSTPIVYLLMAIVIKRK